MLKTRELGVGWCFPLNTKSKIKCDGYKGVYTIIDAVTYNNQVFVLLEHDYYGDETALLLATLPQDGLRWYVIERDGKQIKCFFINMSNIINETWDPISVALSEVYPDAELEDFEYWTDEEMEAM